MPSRPSRVIRSSDLAARQGGLLRFKAKREELDYIQAGFKDAERVALQVRKQAQELAALSAYVDVLVAIASSGTVLTDIADGGNEGDLLSTVSGVPEWVAATSIIAAADAMVFKGVVDCSANPNYPAADQGHTYRVSVAGKIGGGSGVNVEAGDLLLCLADSTASGNQATVGASWSIAQTNLDGAVIGPASVTDAVPALFDGTTGKLLKATTFSAFKTALGLVKADVGLGSVLNVPQREVLTASRTYYVRTDGSDSNTGLANTSGGAFLTLQKAMDTIAALDISTYTVTVNVAAGTYAARLLLKSVVGAGTIAFVGDATTPANVVIAPSTSGHQAVYATGVYATVFTFSGFKLAGNTVHDARIDSPCKVSFSNIEWAGTSAYRVSAAYGALVALSGANHQLSGGGYSFLHAEYDGILTANAVTVTLLASVTYTAGFVSADVKGTIQATNSATFTLGIYSVTGARYAASMNAIIYTAGGGASYFPGSSGGSTATGAQYA